MRSRKHILSVFCVPEDSMERRFERWVSRWPTCCTDLALREKPALQPLGTDLGRSARLSLGGKVRGDLFLRLREMLVDDSSCDDWIELEFTPARVRFQDVLEEWLPASVAAFEPYLIELAPEETLIEEQISRRERKESGNKRHRLLGFQPATFLTAKMCSDSFALQPAQLAEILHPVCQTRLVGSGVLVVMSPSELSSEELSACREEIASRLVAAGVGQFTEARHSR